MAVTIPREKGSTGGFSTLSRSAVSRATNCLDDKFLHR
jgi:hypothetical protein